MVFLCIDVGGTNTLFGIGDEEFEKVKQVKTEEFLANINKTIDSVIEDVSHDSVDQIAVAVAGAVNREEGLFYPPNINQDAVQIVEPLEKYAETTIVNDCAAAVTGEYFYGESSDNLLYVTISSGIGAAYMTEGRLIKGASGNFGEVGHMKIGDDLECGCGGTGHWEAYCSGNNIPKMTNQLYDLDIHHARDLFKMNNQKAEKAIEEFKYRTCVGIANLVNLFNPDKIVFGGAVALNHFDDILDAVEDDIEAEAINEAPEMKLCELGEIAVLHGLRATCNGEIEY